MKNILLGVAFFLVTILSFGQSFEGFALYNSQGSNTTYLIDENLNIAHTWNLSTECNYTVQLKTMETLFVERKTQGINLRGAADWLAGCKNLMQQATMLFGTMSIPPRST